MATTIERVRGEERMRAAVAQKRRRWVEDMARRLLVHSLLLLLSLVALVPVLWMISSSLKASTEIFVTPIRWMPETPRWGNYAKAFESAPLWLYFWNTMIICAGAVLGTVLSAAPVAFSFSRLRWPGREFFFGLLLATM